MCFFMFFFQIEIDDFRIMSCIHICNLWFFIRNDFLRFWMYRLRFLDSFKVLQIQKIAHLSVTSFEKDVGWEQCDLQIKMKKLNKFAVVQNLIICKLSSSNLFQKLSTLDRLMINILITSTSNFKLDWCVRVFFLHRMWTMNTEDASHWSVAET